MTKRWLAGLLCALAPAPGWPAVAAAHDDPPRHTLPAQDVFFPRTPPVSEGVARALVTLTRRARAAGWPVKVAIIARPSDMGTAAALFGRPQAYADALGADFGGPRLLVVMPQGFGGQRLGDDLRDTLAGLGPAGGTQQRADGLALAALTAVARLAARNGHRLMFPTIDRSAESMRAHRRRPAVHRARAPLGAAGDSRSRATGEPALLFVAALALVLLAIWALALVDRSRRPER